MKKQYLLYVTAFGFFLVVLNLVGYFFPGSLNWGSHFLGFLPVYVTIGYILAALLIFFIVLQTPIDKFINQLSSFIDKHPLTLLTVVVLLFVGAAFAFRVKASLLGDSFTLIYNLRDHANGISFLAPWHEPLSIYFLYFTTTLIGSLNYPQIFHSFFIIELILGSIFIVVTFFIVRRLLRTPTEQLLVFLFLIVAPYMEVYFGYIEMYSVSMTLLTVFIFLSLLILERKISFYILPPIWLFLTLSHYINALFGLSVIYLLYLEYKQKQFRSIAIGIGITIIIAIGILFAANFKIERLINISPVSHFLSLSPDVSLINVYSQVYTIFSPYHFVEILNYFLFMSPFAVLIIVLWWTKWKNEKITSSSFIFWFVLNLVPVGIFYFIAKLEQGNASDWDVFAPQFYLLNLFAAYILFKEHAPQTIRILTLIVLITLLQSIPWFMVNASAEPSIRRFQTLWDKRILSHLGNYTHALRLVRYYDSQKDSLLQINVWEQYSTLYPGDPRGYANILEAISKFTPNDYKRKISTYELWLTVDPENNSLKSALGSVCLDAGNDFFNKSKIDTAQVYFKKANLYNPSPIGYNNLGSTYAQQSDYEKAIGFFQKAIELDSTYSDAYYNLGMVYLETGDPKKGLTFIKKAASYGNQHAIQLLLMQTQKDHKKG